VEFQSYTIIRGFLGIDLKTSEEIHVSPSPSVPNWNELLLLPEAQKEKSSALLQLLIVFEQHCAPSPLPADDDLFYQYIVHLAKFYLRKLKGQEAAAADAEQIATEEVGEPRSAAGPSIWEVGESSSGAVG